MANETLSRVVKCIATTTRYPVSLLGATADLENDLGIDSVKRLEIVVSLEEEFGLPLTAQERDPSIRTIADIADWIDGFGNQQSSSASVLPPVQQPNSGTSVEPTAYPPVDSFDRLSPAGGTLGSDTNQPSTVGVEQTNGNSLSSRPQLTTSAETHHQSVSLERQRRVHQPDTARIPDPHYPLTTERPTTDQPTQHRSLQGKIALVTGSGRGVGRIIARVLASRGATVIVNSFHSRELGEQTTQEIVQDGGTAYHLWGSVANSSHVDEMFAWIEKNFGRMDILVCNASDGRIGSFMELTPDDWDRAFRTNVIGHHQCAVRASKLMRRSGGGSIVTLSAVGAKGYVDGLGSQGIVKAAVETFTRYLAGELGKFGIRANCVAGGPVYGELISKFPNAESAQQHWESMTPDGQLCSPMDLANTIAFLVSEEASGINGSVWMVDHGFSAMAAGHPMQSQVGQPILTATV